MRTFAKLLPLLVLLVACTTHTAANLPTAPALEEKAPARAAAAPTVPSAATAARLFDQLPLRFEKNEGQLPQEVEFQARTRRAALTLTKREAILVLAPSSPDVAPGDRKKRPDSKVPVDALRLRFLGAAPSPSLAGEDALAGKTSYFIGDRSTWRSNVTGFGRVRYSGLYPGVDAVFYGRDRELEYDLVVHPGAELAQVALAVDGAQKVRLTPEGDAELTLPKGTVHLKRPVAYQDVDGVRRAVESRYQLRGNRLSFEVGRYDRQLPLVVDPVLAYATYLGAYFADTLTGAAVDGTGRLHIAGFTLSPNFPTKNALYPTYKLPPSTVTWTDAFVATLDATGTSLVYSTFLGGAGGSNSAYDVAVDAAGQAYVVGYTDAPDFPVTANAYSTTPAGFSDLFLTKFSADGSSLLYSTFFGTAGGDTGNHVAVDELGMAYAVGVAGGYIPLTAGAYQTIPSANYFLAKFDTTKSGAASLVYSSWLDGTQIKDIAADQLGQLYFVGVGAGFLDTSKGFTPAAGSAFVARLDTTVSGPTGLVYGSRFGGSGADEADAVAIDGTGKLFVVGRTFSTDLPTKNAYQPSFKGYADAFAAVFDTNATGPASLLYSTFLGGSSDESGAGAGVDANGFFYVAGNTSSADFPLRAPFQASFAGDPVFVAKLDPRASGDASLIFSSFYAGPFFTTLKTIAVDPSGNVYLAGDTASPVLPTVSPIQPALAGPQGVTDAFVAKISNTAAATFAVTAVNPPRAGQGQVTMQVHGTGFVSGAAVKLARAGATDVPAASVSFTSPNELRAVFNLTGVAIGPYDVVVTNPGGASATLTGGFVLEAATAFTAVATLIMDPAQRIGHPTHAFVTYTNTSNVDVILPLQVIAPLNKTIQLGVPALTGPLVPMPAGVDPATIFNPLPTTFDTATARIMPLMIYVPAGQTGYLPVTIPEGCTQNTPLRVTVAMGTPKTPNQWALCTADLAQLVFSFAPGNACAMGAAGLFLEGILPAYSGQPETLASWTANILMAIAQCAASLFPPTKLVSIALTITDQITKALSGLGAFQDCAAALQPKTPGQVGVDGTCYASKDPNDKVGPPGAGAARYISGKDPLPYSVFFENQATANAAAQTVTVTDQLDPTRVALSTFALGPITFGNTLVVPPPGLSSYTTDVDLRPGTNLIVRISAGLNTATAIASWSFVSLDPTTMQPTTNALLGFLPPDVVPPQGEGAVLFTVSPLPTLATNDAIRNHATVVFDVNAPIVTPEWLDTIDVTPPTSAVQSLAAVQSKTNFTVSWAGTDTGAGIAGYSIFVSDNGGPFTLWLDRTALTTATYPGANTHSYAFFSLALDAAGNAEAPKTVGEATTKVVVDTTPPVTTGTVTPAANAAGWHAADPTISLSATDDLSGVREVHYAATGAQVIPETIVGGATASLSVTQEGTTVVRFFSVDWAGNIETAQELTIRLDKTPPLVTCQATPALLWPPDHRLVPVSLDVRVVDGVSGAAGFTLLDVVEVPADQNPSDDIVGFVLGTPDTSGWLRAEWENGVERRYVFTYSGRDVAGNAASCSTAVRVNHPFPDADLELRH